jgi:hypothetical protein
MATSQTIEGLQKIKMQVTDLSEEQIKYEWEIRFPEKQLPILRDATRILSPVIAQEFAEHQNGPGVGSSPNTPRIDLEACNLELSLIRITIDGSRDGKSLSDDSIGQAKSKLRHIGERLRRIVHDPELDKAIATAEETCKQQITEVNLLLVNNHKRQSTVDRVLPQQKPAVATHTSRPSHDKPHASDCDSDEPVSINKFSSPQKFREQRNVPFQYHTLAQRPSGAIRKTHVEKQIDHFQNMSSLGQECTPITKPNNSASRNDSSTVETLVEELRRKDGRLDLLSSTITNLQERLKEVTQDGQNAQTINATPTPNAPVAIQPTTSSPTNVGINRRYLDPNATFVNLSLAEMGMLARQPHKIRIALDKWKCSYNGNRSPKEGEDNLADFLRQVKSQAESNDMPLTEAIRHMNYFLTGQARTWYSCLKEKPRTWEEFESKIKRKFLPQHYDYDHAHFIYNRKQKKNETVSEFINEMVRQFSSLTREVSEAEQCIAIQKNLKPEIAKIISVIPF